jgi:hypothetical protein
MDPDVLEPLLQHNRILSSILRPGDRPPMPLGAFSDLETDLRESMDRLRACPYLPHRDDIRGFVLDMASGRLREVTIGSDQTV